MNVWIKINESDHFCIYVVGKAMVNSEKSPMKNRDGNFQVYDTFFFLWEVYDKLDFTIKQRNNK